MPKFRKKPVIVAAERFRKIRERGESVFVPDCVVRRPLRRGWWVRTLEGWYGVQLGDWIVTGVRGERYPVRADIFAATYEPADAPDATAQLHEALAFAASVIKSGEPWTDTCERIIGGALSRPG